jgi:hypothetical protein
MRGGYIAAAKKSAKTPLYRQTDKGADAHEQQADQRWDGPRIVAHFSFFDGASEAERR